MGRNIITFLFLVILTITLISGCGKKEIVQQSPPEVKFVTSVQKDVPIKQEWVGQTLGAEDIEVRSRVDGIITGIYFVEGTTVNQGTLLYTIDPNELLQKVANAKGTLTAAQTMLVQAESDVKRYTPLAEQGAVSQRTLEIAVATYDARKGDVESALASLNLAKINLGYASITAPITGIIGITNYKVGDYVSKITTGPLNTVSNVDPIHVRFSISEQEYLTLIKKFMSDSKLPKKEVNDKGEKAVLELILADNSIYEHTGKINVLQRQIDPSTGTLMLESSFPNPDKVLRPGQYAKVRTTVETLKGAVVIPLKCMFEIQGTMQAYVINAENMTELRTLKVGPKIGQLAVIESGIKPNEKVISEGILKIKPGIPVKQIDSSTELDSLINKEGLK
ncbi:MAG: efflux RND transporter periplasmic adaptor subunit [Ignavibacteria bacterium]|jgi:membrane fusion protein (multidrug efflux system)